MSLGGVKNKVDRIVTAGKLTAEAAKDLVKTGKGTAIGEQVDKDELNLIKDLRDQAAAGKLWMDPAAKATIDAFVERGPKKDRWGDHPRGTTDDPMPSITLGTVGLVGGVVAAGLVMGPVGLAAGLAIITAGGLTGAGAGFGIGTAISNHVSRD